MHTCSQAGKEMALKKPEISRFNRKECRADIEANSSTTTSWLGHWDP